MPDVEILARLQFAFTIMFHYIFPPLTIGLGWLMVISEGLSLWKRDAEYEQLTRFWTKIFAVNFAMGVATGIVMEFQFGTNWAAYSRFVGDVFGSALAAEGIFAFFLESGFLAVLVFGWDRVSRKVHFFSTCMVALGATFSAVWIVVANSWQQTPAGYHIVGEGLAARAEITDFWAMVFNPSSVDRLNHVLIGALILGAFFVMSISAYYLLRRRHEAMARKGFGLALAVGLIASLSSLVSGHFQAKTVAETQPAKLAAFEGHFHSTEGGAPLWLFGLPVEEAQEVRYGMAIPGGLSFLVHEDFKTPVTALDAYAPEDRPPVAIPFLTYHLMVAIGLGCIALTTYATWRYWRGTLYTCRWLLWVFVFAVLGPYLANQAGWVAAEVGRQPWIVYGMLRTSDALSAAVRAEQVLGSIIMFGVIYTLLLSVWIYVLNDKIQTGPEPAVGSDEPPSGGLLDTAASLTDHSRGHSLTEAHVPVENDSDN
jgi:cytochrome bd ubiquinol oxidase subunit I